MQRGVAGLALIIATLFMFVAALPQPTPSDRGTVSPVAGFPAPSIAHGTHRDPAPMVVPSGNASPSVWPAVQLLFLVETTPYDGVFDPTDHDFGLDPCLAAGATHPCEESNGVPFFLRYAQEIASGITSAHPGVNVSFAMADYFATLDGFDDGDGAEYHVDVGNFSPASQFGAVVNSTFGATVAPNGTMADSDMNDSLLHSSSITALYGSLTGQGLGWSTSAHHVVVQIGSTAPRAPGYSQNYSVSASAYAENLSSSNALSSSCEPSYLFAGGASPNCEGWTVAQDGNLSHSIAELANHGSTCASSVGGTCTVDEIDLWTTATDPSSPGWPTQFSTIGGGPNGTVVRNNAERVLAAGCTMANATGGTWAGPIFSTCMGRNGTLNFTGLNSTFSESSRLYQALLDLGFGNPSAAAAYPLDFDETGLSAGTSWSVSVAGVSRSSTSSQISFDLWNGTYRYSITPVAGYETTWSGSITILGENVTLSVSLVPVTYTVEFAASGLPAGTYWGVTLADSTRTSSTSIIAFQLPNGTYAYHIPPVPGYSTKPQGNVTVMGGDRLVPISFAPETYAVTFRAFGLPSGQVWSVTLSGTSANSTGPDISFSEPNGSYTYLIGHVAGYGTDWRGNVTVNGSAVGISVTFSPFLFPIDLITSGLAPGTNWSVTIASSFTASLATPPPCVSPCNWTAWSGGASTILASLANGTYAYTAEATGYFTVSGSVIIENGSPATVALAFRSTSSGAPTVLGLPPVEGYLLVGVIILAAGVAAGMAALRLVHRRPEAGRGPDTDRMGTAPRHQG